MRERGIGKAYERKRQIHINVDESLYQDLKNALMKWDPSISISAFLRMFLRSFIKGSELDGGMRIKSMLPRTERNEEMRGEGENVQTITRNCPLLEGRPCLHEKCQLWVVLQKPIDPLTRASFEGCGLLTHVPWRLEGLKEG